MAVYTIFQQISILAILAGVGIIATKTKILGVGTSGAIEKLVFFITLPFLIVTKLSELELNSVILNNGLKVILFTYAILIIQIIIGRLSSRLLKLKTRQAVIHEMHTFLGNIVFLGFPLLDALFPGGEAILYAALYQLVMNSVLWSYGIMQLAPENKDTGLMSMKKMLNPNTIALLVGLIMVLLNIKLPNILRISLGSLGDTTLYLAMIYIGILLAGTHLKHLLRKWDVLLLSFNKLLLIPALLIGIFVLLFRFTSLELDPIALSVLVLETSMPCMTILVLLAKRYGADDQKAMENFVVSTVASIFSLPLVLIALQWFT